MAMHTPKARLALITAPVSVLSGELLGSANAGQYQRKATDLSVVLCSSGKSNCRVAARLLGTSNPNAGANGAPGYITATAEVVSARSGDAEPRRGQQRRFGLATLATASLDISSPTAVGLSGVAKMSISILVSVVAESRRWQCDC
ncbi:MAG: hypothetical protein U1F34_07055 [Gammaproteobacteria bacterium]